MRTTPVVNRHRPPAQGLLGIRSTGEGQAFAYLSGTHETSRAVASLNSRGIGRGVFQSSQRSVNAFDTAMDVANFDCGEPLPLTMLHDLGVRGSARNAIADLGTTTACSLTSRLVGAAKKLWEQSAVGSQAIGEQGDVMGVSQAARTIRQQAADQRIVATPLHMGHHKLTGRVYQFRFPDRLLFAPGKTIPFVGLQGLHFYLLDLLLMILLTMAAQPSIQAPHGFRVHAHQACRTLEAAPFSQMFCHRYGLRFGYLAVPQRCLSAFAEFFAAMTASHIANVVFAVHLAHFQFALSLLSIQFALRVDTC